MLSVMTNSDVTENRTIPPDFSVALPTDVKKGSVRDRRGWVSNGDWGKMYLSVSCQELKIKLSILIVKRIFGIVCFPMSFMDI